MNRLVRLICVLIGVMLFAAMPVSAEPVLTVADLSDTEREIYNLVQSYVDQGDAKSAALVLAEEDSAASVFSLLYIQNPDMWNHIMLEAMNHFDEDGDLLHMITLRTKGCISDEIFGDYREQRGFERTTIEEKQSVDAYLLDELVRVYGRGGESCYILIDLRYWGIIDDEMHLALIERLNLDYMDEVDMDTYIPRTAYLINGEEMMQYKLIQEYIDEGDALSVTELMLQGDVSDDLYAYIRKNDGEVLDLVMAQSLAAYADAGRDECIIQLCVDGFISDQCFEYYWEIIGCELPMGLRTDERYEGIDMYLQHEIKMIAKHRRLDDSFIKELWLSEILDEKTKDFMVNHLGGWEE